MFPTRSLKKKNIDCKCDADCRICVWNASDGSLVHSLTGHTESVSGLFSCKFFSSESLRVISVKSYLVVVIYTFLHKMVVALYVICTVTCVNYLRNVVCQEYFQYMMT